jgi:anti-sigma-K factor RskA
MTAVTSSRNTILWVVLALAALTTAVVIAALAWSSDDITKPLLVAFFGMISTAIPSIVALYKVDEMNTKVEALTKKGETPDGRQDV